MTNGHRQGSCEREDGGEEQVYYLEDDHENEKGSREVVMCEGARSR